MLVKTRVWLLKDDRQFANSVTGFQKFWGKAPVCTPSQGYPESLPAIPIRIIVAVQRTEESWPGSRSAFPKFDPVGLVAYLANQII